MQSDAMAFVEVGNVSGVQVAALSAPHLVELCCPFKQSLSRLSVQGVPIDNDVDLSLGDVKEARVLLLRHVHHLHSIEAFHPESVDELLEPVWFCPQNSGSGGHGDLGALGRELVGFVVILVQK